MFALVCGLIFIEPKCHFILNWSIKKNLIIVKMLDITLDTKAQAASGSRIEKPEEITGSL
jgi:hypothetical protein